MPFQVFISKFQLIYMVNLLSIIMFRKKHQKTFKDYFNFIFLKALINLARMKISTKKKIREIDFGVSQDRNW